MENNLFKLIIDKDYTQIRKILSANPELVNEGVALNNNPNAKKGHPLHRLCDAVFAKKIADEDAIEIAKIFLESGANINGYQSLGDNNTPLIAAASLHAEKLGIFYIEQGADIFYVSPNDGATALHWASFCGRDKLVQKLIEKGAKLDQRDTSFNGTPLDWAVHELRSGDANNLFHQRECIKLLINAGAELNSVDAEYLKLINFFE
jgi:ankyrin repeat protein